MTVVVVCHLGQLRKSVVEVVRWREWRSWQLRSAVHERSGQRPWSPTELMA